MLSSVPSFIDNIYTSSEFISEGIIFSLINLRMPKLNDTSTVSSFEVRPFSIRLSRNCFVNVSDFQHLTPMCFHFAKNILGLSYVYGVFFWLENVTDKAFSNFLIFNVY